MIVIARDGEQIKKHTEFEAEIILNVRKDGRIYVRKSSRHDCDDLELFLNKRVQEVLLSHEVLSIMLSQ